MIRPRSGIAGIIQVTAIFAAGSLSMRLSVAIGCLVLALAAIALGRSM